MAGTRFRALLACCLATAVASLGPSCTVASEIEIPEPMVFDLVRGLGAEQGELEANLLVVAPLRDGDPAAPEAAPEIEYAVADGLAVEFELPFEDDGLYSVKTAVQATLFADEAAGTLHGVQLIAERVVDYDAWDFALLWVPGVRIDQTTSLLAMVGVGGVAGSGVDDELGVLANATLFEEIDPHWTFGLEVDTEHFGDLGTSALLMPQLQWEGDAGFTVQFGAGALWIDGSVAAGSEQLVRDSHGWFPQVAVRGILEF